MENEFTKSGKIKLLVKIFYSLTLLISEMSRKCGCVSKHYRRSLNLKIGLMIKESQWVKGEVEYGKINEVGGESDRRREVAKGKLQLTSRERE